MYISIFIYKYLGFRSTLYLRLHTHKPQHSILVVAFRDFQVLHVEGVEQPALTPLVFTCLATFEREC